MGGGEGGAGESGLACGEMFILFFLHGKSRGHVLRQRAIAKQTIIARKTFRDEPVASSTGGSLRLLRSE